MNENKQKDLKLFLILFMFVVVIIVIYKATLFYSQGTLVKPKQKNKSARMHEGYIGASAGFGGMRRQFSEKEMKKLRKNAESIVKLFKEEQEKMIKRGIIDVSFRSLSDVSKDYFLNLTEAERNKEGE